jgi:predicted metalloprotease with PDZ domain
MRARLMTIPCLVLFLAACHPPDIDLPEDEEPGEDELRNRPVPVAPRVPSGDAIEHTLRFPEPHTHYVDVESVFPTDGRDELTLFMAVWTPGSYLVREFSGHVEALGAATLEAEPLAVDQPQKNRWTVTTGGEDRVVVRYRVYARGLSVQESFIDDDVVVLNGASIFLCPVDRKDLEHDVVLELAEDQYPSLATSLPPHRDGVRRFVAADYDTLVDSPIVAGEGEVRSFDVGGATFELWTFGGDELWDHDRAARDVAELVRIQAGFWGVVPFERYLFLNVAEDTGGGLEHLESTLMMTRRYVTRRPADYRRWLGLVSHELFHAWNGKRLRPDVLGPFDYEREVRTPSLWFVEGLTSYYDDVLLARAGLLTEEQYLERLSDGMDHLRNTPGRRVQSLAEASSDTWIKYYRHDENSDNSTISYYNKGSLVGFLIDAWVRRRTAGQKSLDDVMRLMYERHSGDRGYSPDDVRSAIEVVVGEERPEGHPEGEPVPPGEVDALMDAWILGTEPLPLADALDYYGLTFAGGEDEPVEDEDDDPPAGWLGVELDGNWVTEVRRGAPAHRGGINYDDEIIAIDGYRVRDVGSHLERHRPGDTVTVSVARRGRMRDVQVTLGRAPAEDAFDLQDAEALTAAERAHRAHWLSEARVLSDAAIESASGRRDQAGAEATGSPTRAAPASPTRPALTEEHPAEESQQSEAPDEEE